MFSIREALKLAQTALSSAKIDHALIGGLALGGLGVHRATFDIDFLIHGKDKDAAKNALLDAGFEFVNETPEFIHFSGIVQLGLLLANREPSQLMLKRAVLLPELNIKCLCAEDIIGLKIQAYVNNAKRTLQDKADIAAIIEKNADLDWERIKYYADFFNEWPNIQELKDQYDI